MRFFDFLRDVHRHTPLTGLLAVLVLLWLLFSTGVWLAERGVPEPALDSWGEALYWGVAAFSTAGIADTPHSPLALLLGGLWIVIGSMLFFGAIVATITAWFMRPMQRPHKRIIDTIEYNLEQLNELTIEELDLLKATTDTLIEHMERLKQRQREREAEEVSQP